MDHEQNEYDDEDKFDEEEESSNDIDDGDADGTDGADGGEFRTGTSLGRKVFLLYSFFSVIPRRLNFICRRFGTLCSILTH